MADNAQTIYDIAVPLLYSSVICENLTALLYIHPAADSSPRLAGKVSHLGLVKRLYLEQTDKTHIPRDADTMSDAYDAQLSDLQRALDTPSFSNTPGAFPNLETLALSFIFGPADQMSSHRFCRSHTAPDRGRRLRELADLMPRLLLSPRLRHVCQRGGGGLLNFPALLHDPPPSLSSAVLTTHIQPGEEYWSIPLGQPCIWVFDSPGRHPHATVRKTVEAVLSLLGSMRPWSAQPKDQRFLLTIYASDHQVPGGVTLTGGSANFRKLPPGWRWNGARAIYEPGQEVTDLQEAMKAIQGRMAGFGGGKDEIKWLPGCQAGRCGACEL